jgi:GNAT superfamily N-acetyltransferase
VATFAVSRWHDPTRLDDLRAMIHAAFAGLTPPSGVLNETLDDFAARFRDEIVLVAQSGNDIVGSVFCAEKADSLYLTRMAVSPAWRKRGAGRALLMAAEEQARHLGLPKLALRVRQTLPENRTYFERFGFAVTGEGQEAGRTPYYVMERRHGG